MIATTYEGTRTLIETAVLLARASDSPLSVLLPKIVPDPLAVGSPAAEVEAPAHQYKHLIDACGSNGQVRVGVCRHVHDLVARLTAPGMTLLIGGPNGRWRMSPEERFANRLGRLGRRVLFTSTGRSTTSRRTAWAAGLVCAIGVICSSRAFAQAPPATFQYGAFVDAANLSSSTNPPNHLFRNRGTTPRLDELDVNMAAAYLRKTLTDASRFGFEITVQAGHDSELFGFSTTAPNIGGADVLTHLGPTNVSYRAAVGDGLTIQGGIFTSLIGYDSLYARDNFAYTRPWGADYTPYLMLGLNASYPATDRLTVTGFVVNGYWHLAHANDAPSVGAQVAYATTAGATIKQIVLYGPHQPDTSIGLWRLLSNSIVEQKTGRVTIAGDLQVSTEQVEAADRAWWLSLQTPVHWAVSGPWSVTLRPEWCRDSRGRWTGFEQTVSAVTSTLEYRFVLDKASARLRGEYRYDRSTGAGGGFFARAPDAAGPPILNPAQHLAIAALIVSFDGARSIK